VVVQLAVEEPAELSVHVLEGLKEPGPLLEKVTVPLGEVGLTEVSVTVTVHWVGWLRSTDEGLQVAMAELVLCVSEAK